MDLATATPVEIDTELYKHYVRISRLEQTQAEAQRTIDFIDEIEPGSYNSMVSAYSPARRAKLAALVDQIGAQVLRILIDDVSPLEQEFADRGGWTRYYLVDNSNGHVHPDTKCSSCYPTTVYAWMIEESGMSAEDLVEKAGEQACTICFPWAPVDTLKRKSKLESPERKEARLAREKAKAEREAKKAAKGITTPEGNPLRVFTQHYPERQVVRNGVVVKVHPAHDGYDTLETLFAAKSWLTDQYASWLGAGGSHHRDIDRVARSIAHKLGTTPEAEIEAAKKRAKNRK